MCSKIELKFLNFKIIVTQNSPILFQYISNKDIINKRDKMKKSKSNEDI